MTGGAPSLTTLQRHAKAGELADCQVVGRGKRTHYDPERIKERYRQWSESAARPKVRSVPALAPGLMHLPPEQTEMLARSIVSSLLPELARLAGEVAGLNSVRASLMQKYDSSAALALDRAEALTVQLTEVRKLVDVDMRVARLAVEVAKLSEKLARALEEK